MKRRLHIVAVVLACVFAATSAFAQGGGASTTGTISGKITDSSGAVLPGVTVNATSPSMMGVQTTVSDTGGTYRFPALPPGTYNLAFELPGFNTLKREGIIIAMGFTANVNVELSVAAVQETVTVTGDSPVIDTSSTRVQQNFKLEALQETPNARDMWSLLAVTPSVQMSRIDVGGNRAGTQTGYTAYGYSGQNRVLVEGINTTEGTSGAGFYFDYGSFEEVFLGTIAQGAEMPTPGVQSQFLGKSGGNKFQGEIYQDYENNSMQGDNIAKNVPTKFLFDPATNPGGAIRDHSNELDTYHDFNINVGGPIAKDKVWWYFSHRYQFNAVGQPNFTGPIAGQLFNTSLWNPSGKVTYQVNQNNKLIGYYQWGQKTQPNRLPFSTLNYTSLEPTLKQVSGSWVYKGEWQSTLSNKMYAEARYGVFGYYFPLITNTDTTAPEIRNNFTNILTGGDQKEQTDRQRRQATGAITYFKDGWGGTHNLKFGGEFLLETGWFGYTQDASANIFETIGTAGTPTTVQLYAPTATHVGSLGDGPNGNLLSIAKLDTYDAFMNDQYTVGRATFNLGLRWDHYRAWTPQQHQLAYSFGPLSIPDATFDEKTYTTWDAVAPRVGLAYDIFGTGKTVAKINYGFYRFNPGVGLADSANANQSAKSVTFAWTDTKVCATCRPGDGIYQPGEEGSQTATALAGTTTVDPNLLQPYSNQFTTFLEQQLAEGVGAHVGFVLYKVANQFATIQANRPGSLYTQAFTFADKGDDNTAGTADDQTLTFFGIPNAVVSTLAPIQNQVQNTPNNGTYKTIEFALNKRQSHNYSLNFGAGYTWLHDFPAGGTPITPNGPFDYDYSTYSAKATATYTAPYGIFLSGSYRFQSGNNYARTLSVAAPSSCACTFSASRGGSTGNTTVFATAFNAYRQDNISVLDLRIEKTVPIANAAKVRLFFDIYNIANQYAAETISQATGSAFQQPTAILGPRTSRVGFRFIW